MSSGNDGQNHPRKRHQLDRLHLRATARNHLLVILSFHDQRFPALARAKTKLTTHLTRHPPNKPTDEKTKEGHLSVTFFFIGVSNGT